MAISPRPARPAPQHFVLLGPGREILGPGPTNGISHSPKSRINGPAGCRQGGLAGGPDRFLDKLWIQSVKGILSPPTPGRSVECRRRFGSRYPAASGVPSAGVPSGTGRFTVSASQAARCPAPTLTPTYTDVYSYLIQYGTPIGPPIMVSEEAEDESWVGGGTVRLGREGG